MLKKCIVPRLATALGLTAAFAVVTLLASSPSPARPEFDQGSLTTT
jgi:hypothetical protein